MASPAWAAAVDDAGRRRILLKAIARTLAPVRTARAERNRRMADLHHRAGLTRGQLAARTGLSLRQVQRILNRPRESDT